VALEILAGTVHESKPDRIVDSMTNARFGKFLFLDPGLPMHPVRVEGGENEKGEVTRSLVSRSFKPKGDISRILVHGSATFPMLPLPMRDPPEIPEDSFLDECETFSPRTIYEELVPFGPSFKNIASPVRVWEGGVIAWIQCPEVLLGIGSEVLGSPFALDAAFHAACVWGQRYAGIVAFPVGFEKRRVFSKTRAGERYRVYGLPVSRNESEFIFDLWLWDAEGRLCEAVTGLWMRDVSRGRLRPPGWLLGKGR